MNIIERYEASDPRTAAYAFGTILAGDLGVQNTIDHVDGGWAVTADDGRSILFTEKA